MKNGSLEFSIQNSPALISTGFKGHVSILGNYIGAGEGI